MKRSLTIALLLILSAVAADAQCETEAQAALYSKFVADHEGTPAQRKTASDTGREYLSKYGECSAEAAQKVTIYVRNWIAKYENAIADSECTSAVDSAPATAFDACRPYLAKDPNNLRAHLLLSVAGFKISGSASQKLKDETVKAARKSLELIKAGDKVGNWLVAENKDETVATLEFYAAFLTADSTPEATAATMLDLARSNTSYSKNPNTYYYLGLALHATEVKKLVADYKEKCEGKDPTPECDAAFAKVDIAIDRVIDAYARAVALTYGRTTEFARISTAARAALVDIYKKRHNNSDIGLDKLIAEVLSKPIK